MSLDYNRVLHSFLNSQPRTIGNYSTNGTILLYYSSPILQRHADGRISFSLCGKSSLTARRRINDFFQTAGLSLRLSHRAGTTYLNDSPILSTDRIYL